MKSKNPKQEPPKQEKAQRAFIVDDDEAVRDAISTLLDTLNIANETYASADEFLKALQSDTVGCLVLDVRMPGMSGLELQERLRQEENHIPIIFITGHGDIPMAVEAMRRGAVDFIRKPFKDEELVDRIRQAFDQEASERTDRGTRDEIRALYDALTPREAEVFNRVTSGQANKVVAIELDISERTVEIHRAQVMKKMRTRTLAELVRCKIMLEGARDG